MKKKNDYLKYEREIIDYCQQKLVQCIPREYQEDGSYKPTKADRMLDRELKHMIEQKSALKYAHIKAVIHLLKKQGYEIETGELPKKNIMLWLFCIK